MTRPRGSETYLTIAKASFEGAFREACQSGDFRRPFKRLSKKTRRLIRTHDMFQEHLARLVMLTPFNSPIKTNQPSVPEGSAWAMCRSLKYDLTWDKQLHNDTVQMVDMLNFDNDMNINLIYRRGELSKQNMFHRVALTWDVESLIVIVGAYTRFRPNRVKLILDNTDLSEREAHLITDFLLPNTDPVNQKNRRGHTPLALCINNWPENAKTKPNSSGIALVQLLLEAGARVDADVLALLQQAITKLEWHHTCLGGTYRRFDPVLDALLEVQAYLVSAPRVSG